MAATIASFASWIAGAISGKGVKITKLEETEGSIVLLISESGKTCRVTIEETK